MPGESPQRWVIDQREYMGLVRVLVRAKAVRKALRMNRDGSFRLPPRAAVELEECLRHFAAVDRERMLPCRMS